MSRLVIDLQPDEDISLTIMNKRPGLSEEGMRLQSLPLSLSFGQTGGRRRIDAVVVVDVALASGVARNLDELHVALRQASEYLDLVQKQQAR